MFGKYITQIAAVGFLSFLLACSQNGGFDATKLTSVETAAEAPPGDNSDNTNSGLSSYEKLQYKGFISGGANDGTLVIDIDKATDALLVIVPMQVNAYIESTEGEVPDLPGVKYMTYKDDKGASYFAITVPLRYVLKGASFLAPARLPNGDVLPQMASGELPSVAVTVPGKNKVQLHLYMGVNTVGVYISSPYDPYLPLQFPIRSKGVEIIGYFHTVPAKSGFDGGFFLNMQMPDSIATIIDDHFRF